MKYACSLGDMVDAGDFICGTCLHILLPHMQLKRYGMYVQCDRHISFWLNVMHYFSNGLGKKGNIKRPCVGKCLTYFGV